MYTTHFEISHRKKTITMLKFEFAKKSNLNSNLKIPNPEKGGFAITIEKKIQKKLEILRNKFESTLYSVTLSLTIHD